jgi:hypothetical protein
VSWEHADGLVADLAAQSDSGNYMTWTAVFEQGVREHLRISEAMSRADKSVPNGFVEKREDARHSEQRAQSNLVRDIFGNPFRPITLDPRWLTSTVRDLAGTIYDERVFERLPILADALMDAGCDSEDVIKHCRGEGPHVRGCWVIDLLLERE